MEIFNICIDFNGRNPALEDKHNQTAGVLGIAVRANDAEQAHILVSDFIKSLNQGQIDSIDYKIPSKV